MQVILMERIEKLGQMGDEVNVKPGYARNFLLPKGKAVRANAANRKQFEQGRAQLEAENLKQKSEAEAVGAKMDNVSIILVRQAGDAGQLYGSVNARDVADKLTEDGYTVARSQVRLDVPIKTLGLHQVIVSLHPEVSVTITANVARTTEEAETQAATGKAMLSIAEQEAQAAAEEAANEAVLEQAETMFEEGVEVTVEESAAEESEAENKNTPSGEEVSEDGEEKTE